MNNQELELRVKELLEIENFFDMIIAVKEFEKEYKGSDFYRNTKMPLMEVIKNSKMWYLVNFKDLTTKIQSMINGIELSHLQELIGKIGETFQTENEEVYELINNFKDLGIVK